MRVVVHIDRLVLRGFARDDRAAVGESIRIELERQFAEAGMARQVVANGNTSRLLIGNVRTGPGATPRHIGVRVAMGIGEGVKK